MMLKICVLLFFLFCSALIGDTDKISYVFNWREDPCPFIWDRPDHTSLVPSNEIQYGNTRYIGARHHVIPFNVLRNFFYSAVWQSREASRIGRYLSAYIYRIAAEVVSNGISIQRQRQNPIPVNTYETVILIDPVEEMFAAFSWLPGNIFIGPQPNIRHDDRENLQNQRGGDPGNAFEEYANRIIRDVEHFTALENLNRDIQLYTQDTLNINLFDQIMHNLDIVNRRIRPFPFDERDWEMVGGKFYIRESSNKKPRKKRSQNQIPKPSLARNSEPSSDDDPFDYYVGFCKAVKRRLTDDGNLSINTKYIEASDNMEFSCPKNTYIIVKQAIIQVYKQSWFKVFIPLGNFFYVVPCTKGECQKQDGTEQIKKVCDNKRSCVFSPNLTHDLDVDIDYYCSHDILASIQERKILQRKTASREFELNCQLNYTIQVDMAMRHSLSYDSCYVEDCKIKDLTPVFREKCDGENPCKKNLENWGFQPITVDFSCIPNPSMLV